MHTPRALKLVRMCGAHIVQCVRCVQCTATQFMKCLGGCGVAQVVMISFVWIVGKPAAACGALAVCPSTNRRMSPFRYNGYGGNVGEFAPSPLYTACHTSTVTP